MKLGHESSCSNNWINRIELQCICSKFSSRREGVMRILVTGLLLSLTLCCRCTNNWIHFSASGQWTASKEHGFKVRGPTLRIKQMWTNLNNWASQSVDRLTVSQCAWAAGSRYPRPSTYKRAWWQAVPTVRWVVVPTLPALQCLFASAIWEVQLYSTSPRLRGRTHTHTHTNSCMDSHKRARAEMHSTYMHHAHKCMVWLHTRTASRWQLAICAFPLLHYMPLFLLS